MVREFDRLEARDGFSPCNPEKDKEMVEGIFGKKIGMTHIYGEEGVQIPVTVIGTESCYVVQKKTTDKDGYNAVQLGVGEKKESRTSKPMKGHFKKASAPCLYHTAEFRGENLDELKTGATVNCSDVFKVGDFVDVSGTTKGKGFQGVMKRHGFGGGRASHGSMHGRGPGSIGQSSDPSRVFKGVRMAGHMGNRKATIENLEVVGIQPERNVMLVKGAVPGPVNGYIIIKKAHKKGSTGE